jgi:DNA-binding CsgD family transcriptional regulator/catechol 2,3-dioxygenase-like lactoylglutathione lyase family enzyme
MKSRGRPRFDDELTPAEWRVVEATRHGLSNMSIAQNLGISVDGVKFHIANITGKLGLGTKSALVRWAGVKKSSILAQTEAEILSNYSLGPIGQISRTVSDVQASRAWFEDVLGLKHLFSYPNLAFFDCNGVRLMLTQTSDQCHNSIPYFAVEDVRSAHQGLEAKGITFTHAPHMIHKHEDGAEEWMAFLEDNEGRPLGLMSRAQS